MVPPNDLTRKFQEVLGTQAGDTMADWMQQTEADHKALRQELAEFRQEMRADFAELRHEMHARFAGVDVRFAQMQADMNTRFAESNAEMQARFAEIGTRFAEIGTRFAQAEAAADRRHADFMKWMLGFWAASLVALVAAVYGLAQIVR